MTYARVDAVPVGERLLLMELELIEPVLFLRTSPRADDLLAAAVAPRVG